MSTAPPAPSPLTHSPHPPRPAAFPADAPPDFGAQKAGGQTRGRCGCRGSKGALRTAGERDRGFRAHLAGQLFAPVDPRPCEGFDPRHNPMGAGGAQEDAARTLASGCLGGEGGGGVRPARVGLGDRKSDSPRPAPSASSSNPSLHPRPSSGRGEAGRREGGCRAPDGTPRSVEGRLAQVQGAVD